MRRFSQRNSLVTLNDINITPLLDLAFVLLIIFVITTPLLEQGIGLKLPAGGAVDSPKLDPKNVRTVDVGPNGWYMVGGKWVTLEQAVVIMADTHRRNPQLIVYVRGDENQPYKYVAAILSRLEQAGLGENMSLRTEPPKR